MSALARTSWVSQVLHLLPAPLLRALDAWSHRVAQRRLEERRARWLQRRGAVTGVPMDFHVKALGD